MVKMHIGDGGGGGGAQSLYEFEQIIKNEQIEIDGSGQVSLTGNKYHGQYWAYCLPYEFVIVSEGKAFRWQFPMPPQQIQIAAIEANAITASLGGVVEEVSPNLFWQINIAGTTGIATPKPIGLDVAPLEEGMADLSSAIGRYKVTDFRAVLDTNDIVSATADTLLRQAEGIVDRATDIGNATGTIETAKAILDATQNRPLYSRTAIIKEYNGYTAIHHLRQILEVYSAKKATASREKMPILYFISWKDKLMWRVAKRGPFVIVRSAERPFVYQYNISLIGWEQTTPKIAGETTDESKMIIDRFGPNGDIGNVSTMNATAVLGQLNGLLTNVATNGILNVLAPYPIA